MVSGSQAASSCGSSGITNSDVQMNPGLRDTNQVSVLRHTYGQPAAAMSNRQVALLGGSEESIQQFTHGNIMKDLHVLRHNLLISQSVSQFLPAYDIQAHQEFSQGKPSKLRSLIGLTPQIL